MDDDETAAELVTWLGQRDYTTIAAVVDQPHVGDRTVRLRRGDTVVTVIRDRGEWYVEAGPQDRDGFDINVWDAVLRDRAPSVEPLSFADDVRLLREMLHDIERTLVLDAGAVDTLDRQQTWVEEARWTTPVY